MKNVKLNFLLNLLQRYGEEATDSDGYVDLFYSAFEEMEKSDLIEVIWSLINALLYNNDFEEIAEELKDNYIIEVEEEE